MPNCSVHVWPSKVGDDRGPQHQKQVNFHKGICSYSHYMIFVLVSLPSVEEWEVVA